MGTFRVWAWWILILFVAVAVLSGEAAGQDNNPGQQVDPAALPFAGDLAGPFSLPDRIQAAGDWSLLAYQKLTDDWDIVVHDKSGPRRLTSGAGNDQQPSLDRGARRVAFVSDRGGDLDLYTINVDGTDMQRILNTRSNIGFPAWSPDGQQIAIQSGVAGQYEIFVVNADGSSPQRLTNHPAFDGMPTWSPDGKQLAFASNRSGDYRIYIINSDGSGLRRLSSFPFSLHPTWSPNGRSIAFDADVDGDGWQELATIEAGGARERMIYNPAGDVTAWAGSWSPDNQALGFTEITAELRGGTWVWTKGIVRQWSPSSGTADLVPGGKEWYMNWQTKDAIPPETMIDPLPAYSRAEDFVLRWSGNDHGGAGVKWYDVYYNAHDGGGWRTLLTQTTKTGAAFAGKPGNTVEFLVIGTDYAFNRGIWRLQNSAQTSFFKTMIGGMITDNRGTPLSGVPVTMAPQLPFSPVLSDWQGSYSGYTAEDRGHTLSIREPNFLAVPATTAPSGSDFRRDIYLAPQNSRIRNGTFEQSASKPAEWSSGGSLPAAITADNPATGKYALRLGYAAVTQSTEGGQNAGTASIAQEVTIPATMEAPTLSYMVRPADGPAGTNSGLRVLIDQAAQAPAKRTDRISAGEWSLNWIDMTPWLGQKVLITFEMIQDAGDPPQSYYLDDISLGSANPDLWVSAAVGPAAALPGEVVAIRMDYGNRGPVAAENGVIELALPAALELVSATPPYTIKNNVLHWEIGDLPAHGAANRLAVEVTPASRVQQSVSIKALIFGGTAEAHMRNNIAESTLRIGKQIYLPLLR